MGKMQRNKGKTWEREVAATFRAMFGQQVKRGWQAREGHDAPDVDGVPRFRIEAKHHKVVNIAAAVKQALVDREKAKDKRWALAVTKSNRAVPLATMTFAEFMQLLKEWVDAVALATETPTERCMEQRDTGDGGCGACALCVKEVKDKLDEALAHKASLENIITRLERQLDGPDGFKARVRQFEARTRKVLEHALQNVRALTGGDEKRMRELLDSLPKPAAKYDASGAPAGPEPAGYPPVQPPQAGGGAVHEDEE